jgi:succinyl-CoA synthetase beta subunit
MRLLEFQGKRLLRDYGIRVPHGTLIDRAEDLRALSFPRILKAQVPVGGRGKSGAIQRVDCLEDAETTARRILSMEVKGWPVRALLAEKPAPCGREIYISLLPDCRSSEPVVLASAEGGVQIEEAARRECGAVLTRRIDSFLGICEHDVRAIARHIGVDAAKLSPVLQSMWQILRKDDASLVEINPLLETPNGFLALDAKIVLDDRAAFRHRAKFDKLLKEAALLDARPRSTSERLAEAAGITYVPLSGSVGLISDGAGTGMLTLDLIQAEGGLAANFCEMGGLSNSKTMCETLRVVLADEKVESIVVSLIGGLTRMDEMAEGVIAYLGDPQSRRVPMVVRMCGTGADVGIPMLHEAGVSVYEDLLSAVRDAVALAGGK